MIIGIDLGTTNSLVSVYRDNQSVIIPNSVGNLLTPSVVSVDGDQIIVGELAKERLISNPELTIANFKRYMGQDKVFHLGKYTFTPEELSSLVIKKLVADAQAYLNEPIDEAIISVPAYFNDDQRWATKAAGELAGVKVERIINEPSAAALAIHHRYLEINDERSYMIVDFGGGTLDVSIVDAFDNIIEIASVAGDNHLGGEDFNQLIINEFLKENNIELTDVPLNKQQLLVKQVEKCKRQLNSEEIGTMELELDQRYHFTLSYQRFRQLAWPLLMRLEKVIYRAIKDSKDKIDNIDDVILVGGSCKMRLVQEYLQEVLNKEVRLEVSPDLAISLGCGIVAGIKERQGEIKDFLLSDICPFTLGTEVSGGAFFPIIERNSVLPCSREEQFVTNHLGQTKVNCGIFQGENMMAEDNLKLGNLEIVVPKNKQNYESVTVRFTYDLNGILEVDAIVDSTQVKHNLTIISKKNRMSARELKQRQMELQKIKLHPRNIEQNQLLLARGNRLFSDTLGEQRRLILALMQTFNEALESQDERLIKKTYEMISKQLDLIEGISEGELFS